MIKRSNFPIIHLVLQISVNIHHQPGKTNKQRGMAADEGEDELIEDLIKFREKHLEKIREEKWKKVQEKIENAKQKHYAQWRKNLFN